MNHQPNYSNNPATISRCEIALEEAILRHSMAKVQDTTSIRAFKSQQDLLHMMKNIDTTNLKSDEHLQGEEKSMMTMSKNQDASAAAANTKERQRKRSWEDAAES